MALLYCSECGNAIAENASAYTGCNITGYAGKFRKLFTVFIVLLLIGSAVFYFSLSVKAMQQHNSHTPIKKQQPWK